MKRRAEAVFNEIAEIEKRSKREECGPTLLAQRSDAILPQKRTYVAPCKALPLRYRRGRSPRQVNLFGIVACPRRGRKTPRREWTGTYRGVSEEARGDGSGPPDGLTGFSADGVKDQAGQREQGGKQHAGLGNRLDPNVVE